MQLTELRHDSRLPVGDIPINNIAPLLQKLGQHVSVGDMIPFMTDEKALQRLAGNLISRGHTLNAQEFAAGEILGWRNVLVAPAVLDAWGMNSIPHDSQDRLISPNSQLHMFQEENQKLPLSMRPFPQAYELFGLHQWRLVYLAAIPFVPMIKMLGKELRSRVIFLHNNKPVEVLDRTLCWGDEIITEGYHLIDFNAQRIFNWQEQELSFAPGSPNAGLSRLGLSGYLQACLSYLKIKNEFPILNSCHIHHWVSRDDKKGTSVCVTQEGDGYISSESKIVVRSFSKPIPSHLRNTGMIVTRPCN